MTEQTYKPFRLFEVSLKIKENIFPELEYVCLSVILKRVENTGFTEELKMKNFQALFLSLLFSASLLRAGTVEKTFYFNNYRIIENGEYQLITFDDTKFAAGSGNPLLPYHAVALLLPPGESADRIEIRLSDPKVIPGHFQLYPRQHSRPLSAGGEYQFVKNEAIYNTDADYPATAAGKLNTAFMNGYSFALSTFTPLKYNPVSGNVSYYSEVTVIIHTASESKAQKARALFSPSGAVLNKVKTLAQNPQEITAYPQKTADTAGDYELLIVTPSQFTAAFDTLDYFYLRRGLRSKMVTMDSIYTSMSAPTDKESLRNFIIQEYQNHHIEYVMLGGDVEHVPYAPFYCVVQSDQLYTSNDIPADLYYSALDGNWNADGDDRYGEIGEEDLLPEVAVGRLSFSDQTELNSMLHKIISYQDSPVLNELDKPLLAGEHLWSDPITWGADYLDLLIGYHEDNGYTTDGIPENSNLEKLYDRELYPDTWSGTTITDKINQGKSFVHHSGHANTTNVMKLYNSDITNENFYGANGTSHNFTMVYTHGCYCGSFDSDDCIAERMVCIDNFAAAFVGNSRYGWFNEGQTEGPSEHLHREFVDALYSDKYFRIGRTHMESKTQTAPWVTAPGQWEEGALRWCFYDCNVLGDPALGIWTNEPIAVQANYQHTIKTSTSSVVVTVTSEGSTVEGLTCVAIKDSVYHGKGVTDAAGKAEIVFDPPFDTEGDAEIIISGYNCKPTEFTLIIDNTLSIFPVGQLPLQTTLVGNYPNPFNPNTVIRYQLSAASDIQLTVYNMLGQKVQTLVNGRQNGGKYSVPFDANDLASGVYLYRLSTGNGAVLTKKMILIR